MELSSQLHAPAALSPGKEPLVPINNNNNNNNNNNLIGIGCEDVGFIKLTLGRVCFQAFVNTVMNRYKQRIS
jgi:hypothetical protein